MIASSQASPFLFDALTSVDVDVDFNFDVDFFLDFVFNFDFGDSASARGIERSFLKPLSGDHSSLCPQLDCPFPGKPNCQDYFSKGGGYRGPTNQTASGRTCQVGVMTHVSTTSPWALHQAPCNPWSSVPGLLTFTFFLLSESLFKASSIT